MKKRLQALGRLKTGQMNKTEQAYANELELAKIGGSIQWYKFEGMKFRLADNTFYTPDFMVLTSGGYLEAHEVKGSMKIFQDDAKVKIKVAASMYPIKFITAVPISKRQGGGWDFQTW